MMIVSNAESSAHNSDSSADDWRGNHGCLQPDARLQRITLSLDRTRIHDGGIPAFALANQGRRRDLQHVCSGRKLLLDWSGRSAISRRHRWDQPLARFVDDAVDANCRAL